MISTGIARKNSTITAQHQRIGRIGDSRPTPRASPKINAKPIDQAAAVSVPAMPGRT